MEKKTRMYGLKLILIILVAMVVYYNVLRCATVKSRITYQVISPNYLIAVHIGEKVRKITEFRGTPRSIKLAHSRTTQPQMS